ncbi:hypothetical protein IHQ56_07620 [Methylobacillus flagellatus]|uniref:hypothetical protein n=1 Tax=Methylobacillus flagellatus TaxID=405 RepID=UPI00285410A1|nr:hypothetical protein [Methylobacillus flagellatus]MDR5171681.1 hypothetical protein [Methylobacillus flagellatus]
MRSLLDFSSGSAILTTLLILVLMSVIMVGIRLIFMQTFQRRRERENRQINERLKVLIAAYKVLGGSFTGELAVDPAHLRDLRQSVGAVDDLSAIASASERRRRIRDAVETALSDVILLGTEEQVRLATQAANDMVAGKSIETAALVVSLRNFIRQSLDLTPIPADITVPSQGPIRVATGANSSKRSGGPGGSKGGGNDGGGASGGIALSGGSQVSDAP